jgi:hypothetical protein
MIRFFLILGIIICPSKPFLKKKHVWETLINKNRGENTYYTNITFLLFLHDNVTMVVPLLIFLYEISSCNFINVSTREMRVLIFLPVK